jgi:hypothetical protein
MKENNMDDTERYIVTGKDLKQLVSGKLQLEDIATYDSVSLLWWKGSDVRGEVDKMIEEAQQMGNGERVEKLRKADFIALVAAVQNDLADSAFLSGSIQDLVYATIQDFMRE